MFTGLVQSIGKIEQLIQQEVGARISVWVPGLAETGCVLGESIAVNGICLTVTSVVGSAFRADVSAETLVRTTVGRLRVGHRVNLERALRAGEAIGGHLVTGHVDGVGEVVEVQPSGDGCVIRIRAPDALKRYIAQKGSLCVDGVSLTVNEVHEATVGLTIVPHTLAATTLGGLVGGATVNLEVDIIARYLERLLDAR